MSGPDVTLRYRSDVPEHFIAAIGSTGWLQGFGWTESEALSELARGVCSEGEAPDGIPAELLDNEQALAEYLARCAGLAVLDE